MCRVLLVASIRLRMYLWYSTRLGRERKSTARWYIYLVIARRLDSYPMQLTLRYVVYLVQYPVYIQV